MRDLKATLKGLRSGVSGESIDQLLSCFTFGRTGDITAASFEDQMESFIAGEEERQEAPVGRLKEIARAIKKGIDEEGVPFEKVFAECD